jgi:hypothetical protein
MAASCPRSATTDDLAFRRAGHGGAGRPVGVVAFAHGSGSGRHGPRNRHVAPDLQAGGLATLLMDLLTPEEEAVEAVTGELLTARLGVGAGSIGAGAAA